MEKTARKPSADPIQEKLRQNKALWNKDVSVFVNDLIHFKKLMNGWPSKFLKERSKILDPIPADPGTIINSLASDFQELVQRGNAIIAEQISYSKNRKHKQIKAPVTPPATNPSATNPSAVDLSKQLAAFETKYDLVVLGSNPITRFFAKLLNPTIGISEAARIRKFRMSLLTSCARFYKDLEKLQAEVVKMSNSSINSSYQHLHQCWNDWILIARGFNIYKLNMPSSVPDSGGNIILNDDIKPLKEDFEQEEHTPLGDEITPPDLAPEISPKENQDTLAIKQIMQDYKMFLTSEEVSKVESSNFNTLNNLIEKFTMAPSANKSAISSLLIKEYQNLIQKVNSIFGTNGTTFKQILDLNNNIPNDMEKISQLYLKKWLGKALHHLSIFDKTSSYRLDIFKMAEDLRKTVDKIMDLLEKDMNVDELSPLVNEVNKKMTALRGLMRALHNSQKPRI